MARHVPVWWGGGGGRWSAAVGVHGKPDGVTADEAAGRLALLHALSAELSRLTDVGAIAELALTGLRGALSLRWAALVLQPGTAHAGSFRCGDCPPDLGQSGASTADGWGDGDARYRQPLMAGGRTLGVLMLGLPEDSPAPSESERALVATVAATTAAAVEVAGLRAERDALEAELIERQHELAALAGQVTNAQEEERRRISLDLHDEPLQRAILLYRAINDAQDHPQAPRWLAHVEDVVTSLRAVCNGLRPRVLDDFGLAAGLEWLANDVRARSDLQIELTTATTDSSALERLPSDLELALYRIAQEALNNCQKHAQASAVNVALWRAGPHVRLTVVDDGKGCAGCADEAAGRGQLGVFGMRERLRPWGGSVTISGGPTGGTVVVAEATVEERIGATG